MKKICVFLITAIVSAVLISCNEEENPREFTVTFNSNGGNAVELQKVEDGKKVIKPDDPTRDGFTFDAWYKEAALTNAWDFDTEVVSADITLHAKWDEDDEDEKNNSITVSGTIFGECATWDEVRLSFDREETWVATAPIQNEEFSLIMPQPDAKLLVTLTDDIFPEEVIVSNNTTKVFGTVIFRAFKGSTKSDYPLLLIGETSKGLCMVDWFYASQDVSIIGSYTDEDGDGRIYDVKMKKGWNVWLSYESKTLNEYGIWTGKVTMTYEIGEIGDIPVGAKWEETPISFD